MKSMRANNCYPYYTPPPVFVKRIKTPLLFDVLPTVKAWGFWESLPEMPAKRRSYTPLPVCESMRLLGQRPAQARHGFHPPCLKAGAFRRHSGNTKAPC